MTDNNERLQTIYRAECILMCDKQVNYNLVEKSDFSASYPEYVTNYRTECIYITKLMCDKQVNII